MDAEKIRDRLREGTSPQLVRNRRIALFSAIGLVDFAIISLYQMGVIRHLPDLPGRIFDSDKVNASKSAYKRGLPDGTEGAIFYAANMALASARGDLRTGRSPLLGLALFGAISAQVLGAIVYMKDMVQKQSKACIYCITGALVNFIVFFLAIPEAVSSIKRLLGLFTGGTLSGRKA